MKIIPKPIRILKRDGTFVLNHNTGIACEYGNITNDFNDFMQKRCGFTVGKGAGIKLIKSQGDCDEAYELCVSEDEIEIKASGEKGLFYGIQTLKQLVNEYFVDKKAEIPCAIITDAPRFEYRGFMFDCCRHFFDVTVVKKLIEACALLKLNVFHWHLTEDQGWRIEIEKYPKLTEIASKRAETRGDKTPVEGYYTKAQIEEVVEYAKSKYIEVIPEFDLPGHTRAILAAYPELSCKGEAPPVATTFGIHKEILCGGNPKTYEFIYDVLDELAQLFPSKYVHVGGDEAVKLEWDKCEKCKALAKKEGLENIEQLQGYLTKKVIEHLKSLGKVAICWNESINSGMLEESAIMQYWQDGKNPVRVLDAIEKGRKTIVSKFEAYYLDYPYGMTRLKKTYEYEPVFFEGDAEAEKNIWGVEAPLWTEYVADFKTIEYRTFPRLTAVAESGWTKKEGKSYDSFVERLPNLIGLLKVYGINSVSAHDANPNAFKGLAELIEFGIKALDKDLIKRSREVTKEISKTRKQSAEAIKK